MFKNIDKEMQKEIEHANFLLSSSIGQIYFVYEEHKKFNFFKRFTEVYRQNQPKTKLTLESWLNDEYEYAAIRAISRMFVRSYDISDNVFPQRLAYEELRNIIKRGFDNTKINYDHKPATNIRKLRIISKNIIEDAKATFPNYDMSEQLRAALNEVGVSFKELFKLAHAKISNNKRADERAKHVFSIMRILDEHKQAIAADYTSSFNNPIMYFTPHTDDVTMTTFKILHDEIVALGAKSCVIKSLLSVYTLLG